MFKIEIKYLNIPDPLFGGWFPAVSLAGGFEVKSLPDYLYSFIQFNLLIGDNVFDDFGF